VNHEIGYWGGGFIGLSGAMTFVQRTVADVWIYDNNPEVSAALQDGCCVLPSFETFQGWTIREALATGRFHVATAKEDVLRRPVQIVAVPTERGGYPDMSVVTALVEEILPTLPSEGILSIESTLQPGIGRKLAERAVALGHRPGETFALVIAPRRDWFGTPARRLHEIHRVIGGWTEACQKAAKALYTGINPLLSVTEAEVAEAVKVMENALLLLPATLIMEASHYLPVDLNEVLRLVGTHWRMPQYHLSAGIGGYCVNMSARYLQAVSHRFELPTLALEIDAYHRRIVGQTIARQIGPGGTAVILGASFKPDFRLLQKSPTFDVSRALREANIVHVVHDPLVPEEILRRVDLPVGNLDVGMVDGLVLMTPHRQLLDELGGWMARIHPGGVFCSCVGDQLVPEPRRTDIRYWTLGDAQWRR
jgi:nucleotide sugar dehydrogenase